MRWLMVVRSGLACLCLSCVWRTAEGSREEKFSARRRSVRWGAPSPGPRGAGSGSEFGSEGDCGKYEIVVGKGRRIPGGLESRALGRLDLRGGGFWPWRREPPKSSISTSVFNLVNNVAGAGLLCLPGGMAAGTGAGTALVTLLALGFASAYTFSLIGYSCHYSGQRSFRGLWSKMLGEETAWALDAGIAVLCFLSAVIYSGIIGDVFTPLLRVARVPDLFNRRSVNICLITAFVLLPLCLLEDLSRLSVTSMLGFASVVYTAIFMLVRCLDGSYREGGYFRDLVAPSNRPDDAVLQGVWYVSPKALVLVSSLGLAFIAHYNAPKYYTELKNRSPQRYNLVVALSFVILSMLYGLVMVAGYYTFGSHSKSNILLNYYSMDALAVLGRIATGLSIIFGFPLTFIGLRESFIGTAKSLLDIMKRKSATEEGSEGEEQNVIEATIEAVGEGVRVASESWTKRALVWCSDRKRSGPITAVLLLSITMLSVAVQDIGFVVGITGSLLGACICYIIPSIIYIKTAQRYPKKGLTRFTRANYLVTIFGVFIAILGVGVTIKEHFFPDEVLHIVYDIAA